MSRVVFRIGEEQRIFETVMFIKHLKGDVELDIPIWISGYYKDKDIHLSIICIYMPFSLRSGRDCQETENLQRKDLKTQSWIPCRQIQY